MGQDVVVVTGGAGFIGSALSRVLAPRAARWVAVDSLHPQVHPEQRRPADLDAAAELVVADVTQPETWDRVLGDVEPTVVIHLAAETGTGQSLSESTRHAHVNVVGTTQMLDGFTRHDVAPAHLLLTSSRAVYGEGVWKRADGSTFQPASRRHQDLLDGKWDFPEAEHLPNSVPTSPPNPSNIYAATKLAQENILASWTAAHDISLSVLRLQNVYGPGQSLANSYTGIVSLFAQMAKRGESIPLYEDGEITRDFVLIDDVVSAVGQAFATPPVGSRLVDVGTGQRTTIRDLASTIAEHYGAPPPHVTGQFRDGDVRHAAADVSPTAEVLGWRPSYSLADGITALAAWIDAQPGGATA